MTAEVGRCFFLRDAPVAGGMMPFLFKTPIAQSACTCCTASAWCEAVTNGDIASFGGGGREGDVLQEQTHSMSCFRNQDYLIKFTAYQCPFQDDVFLSEEIYTFSMMTIFLCKCRMQA